MTQDTLATRIKGAPTPESGAIVLTTDLDYFGTIVEVYPESDEIVIRTHSKKSVTISYVDLQYHTRGAFKLTTVIDLDDPVDTTNINAVLSERGSRYGEFRTHAMITQALKDIFCGAVCDTNWHKLTPSQREALDMTAHKIGRILNGDPNYADSWVDIVGYNQLVVNELCAQQS